MQPTILSRAVPRVKGDARTAKCTHAGMQECRNAGKHECTDDQCTNARMQKCTNAQVRGSKIAVARARLQAQFATFRPGPTKSFGKQNGTTCDSAISCREISTIECSASRVGSSIYFRCYMTGEERLERLPTRCSMQEPRWARITKKPARDKRRRTSSRSCASRERNHERHSSDFA
jgi:hypothetical protein